MRWFDTWQGSLALLCVAAGGVFMAVGFVYDLGVRQGQISAIKTAYEVCRKVAPYKDDGEGCK